MDNKKIDLIIKGCYIYGHDEIEAIAISGEKIMDIGSETRIMQLKNDRTKVIDAKSNTVIPTFVDSHMHPSMCTSLCAGVKMYHVVRQENETRAEYIGRMMEVLSDYVAENPDKEIIIGNGWYPAAFTLDVEGRPTRQDVDKVCADIPVVLRSFDGHAMLVNTKALELAGINENTSDPRGGMFGRDENGIPNGNIYEFTAMEVLFGNLESADFSVAEYEDGIMTFQDEYALPNGITAVFDALIRENAIKAFYNLAKDGRLKINVSSAWVADPAKPESQFDEMIRNKGKYDVKNKFHMKTVKFFIDAGAFGFYTNEPFEKEFLEQNGFPTDYCGEAQWTADELKRNFLKLTEAGYQIHVHCMGDGAVKLTLDAFEYVENMGVKGHRNVITHIMNIADEDVERMAKLDIIAAMQPSWPTIDSMIMYSVQPMFGKKRAYEQYPIGRLYDAGIKITSSTDFPVVQNLNPFLGIQTGMTRSVARSSEDYEKFKGIISGLDDNPTRDCMTLSAMIDSYTAVGAYQMFWENRFGFIQKGKMANLLILDCRIEGVDVMDIENISIDTMILNGEQIES